MIAQTTTGPGTRDPRGMTDDELLREIRRMSDELEAAGAAAGLNLNEEGAAMAAPEGTMQEEKAESAPVEAAEIALGVGDALPDPEVVKTAQGLMPELPPEKVAHLIGLIVKEAGPDKAKVIVDQIGAEPPKEPVVEEPAGDEEMDDGEPVDIDMLLGEKPPKSSGDKEATMPTKRGERDKMFADILATK